MEEVEIKSGEEGSYEIVPLTPLRRLEERIKRLEMGTTLPQFQTIMAEITTLIKLNQKLIQEVMRTNHELREGLARLPEKIDRLTYSLNELLELIKSAPEEEAAAAETPEFREILQIQKSLLETNQQILQVLQDLAHKMKPGTPVSHILARYPNLKIRMQSR